MKNYKFATGRTSLANGRQLGGLLTQQSSVRKYPNISRNFDLFPIFNPVLKSTFNHHIKNDVL